MADTTIGGLGIRRLEHIDEHVGALLIAKNVCTVATTAPDGTIHCLPVWVDTDGEHVLLNTVAGRAWVNNLVRSARVTCTVVNLENPYEFVEIRGRAAKPDPEGADEHIHRLAAKYLGLDEYPWMNPNQPRMLIRVTPERIVHMHPVEDELPAK